MLRWCLVASVIACASPPATHHARHARQAVPDEPPLRLAAMPFVETRGLALGFGEPRSIAVPRFEPHLAVAEAFGITADWQLLCERRGDPIRRSDRDDVLDYLLAWCELRREWPHDPDPLFQLARARSRRVALAARADLVGVLARMPVRDAVGEVVRHESVIDLDTLVGAYLADDRPADAAQLLETLPARGALCDRLVQIYQRRSWSRFDVARWLRRSSDPVCQMALHQVLRCPIAYGEWHVAGEATRDELAGPDCEAARRAVPERMHLADAFARWPTGYSHYLDWVAIAARELRGGRLALPAAEDIAVTALDNAVLRTRCRPGELAWIIDVAARFERATAHPAAWQPRIDRLRALDEAACRALQRAARGR